MAQDNQVTNEVGREHGSRVRELVDMGREVLHLMADPEVHWITKLIPVAAIFYLISPFDFIPDAIPLAGQVDDLAVLIIAARLFLTLAHENAADAGEGGEGNEPATVDATYRVHEE